MPGWIERLYVDYEGAKVKSADPLFEFYSPKLYSAQSEYLSALQMRGTIQISGMGAVGARVKVLDAENRLHEALG